MKGGPVVEAIAGDMPRLMGELRRVREQRDTLLTALRVALHAMRAVDLMSQREAREYAEDAIAKAESK